MMELYIVTRSDWDKHYMEMWCSNTVASTILGAIELFEAGGKTFGKEFAVKNLMDITDSISFSGI
jgi:hypothetical protein